MPETVTVTFSFFFFTMISRNKFLHHGTYVVLKQKSHRKILILNVQYTLIVSFSFLSSLLHAILFHLFKTMVTTH